MDYITPVLKAVVKFLAVAKIAVLIYFSVRYIEFLTQKILIQSYTDEQLEVQLNFVKIFHSSKTTVSILSIILKFQEDLLHHDAYHIVFHPNCKFCRLNRFKLRADSNCMNLSNLKKSFMNQFVLIAIKPSVKNIIETNTSSMHMRKPHSNVITVKRLPLH